MPAVHHHDILERDALADAAAAAMAASGEQWTPMRAKVFDALARFDKPASAYDIAEALSLAEARRVAANTVYRILDLFVAANVATRVESANAYIANAHPDCRHDCIFLICDVCGETEHVDDDRIANSVRRVAGQAGFAAVRPILEVRGRCRQCSAAATA